MTIQEVSNIVAFNRRSHIYINFGNDEFDEVYSRQELLGEFGHLNAYRVIAIGNNEYEVVVKN